MLYVPDAGTTSDDRDLLNSRMRRYAARYYITGPERKALVAQKITALAKEPEALFGTDIPQVPVLLSVNRGASRRRLRCQQDADFSLAKSLSKKVAGQFDSIAIVRSHRLEAKSRVEDYPVHVSQHRPISSEPRQLWDGIFSC